MKFSTVLAITFLVAAVSAAPHSNHENNSNHEDKSNSNNKKIDQTIGSVGSTSNSGLLGGLLGGANIFGKGTAVNKVDQSASMK